MIPNVLTFLTSALHRRVVNLAAISGKRPAGIELLLMVLIGLALPHLAIADTVNLAYVPALDNSEKTSSLVFGLFIF